MKFLEHLVWVVTIYLLSLKPINCYLFSWMSESCLWCRPCPTKKNQGKAPKRIHKAEREKMKREHLNELFIDLANALGNF